MLTQARLKEVLRYDPETGTFTRRTRCGPRKAGSRAGTPHRLGYTLIVIDGYQYRAHRLAWLYMVGAWPQHCIDHVDGNPANDTFSNLRDVTLGMNQQNRHRARVDSKSGFLGVSRKRNGWATKIQVGDKQRNLGTYATPDEAYAVYLAAKRALHPGCTI